MTKRAVDAPPAHGKKLLTLPQKIGAAMGILLLMMFVMGGIMYLSMREANKSIGLLVRSTIPATNAAYEMEINVGEAGVKVLKYLDVADMWSRHGAIKDMNDFDAFHQRYMQAVRTDKDLDIGRKVAAAFADYRAVCLRMMDAAEEQRVKFSLIAQGLRQLDDLVNNELFLTLDPASTRYAEKLNFARGIETILHEIGIALSFYIFFF